LLLLPFYAVAIWLLAGRWRRRWQGVAAVVVGTAVLVLMEVTLARLETLDIGLRPKQVLILLVPFTALVTGVGLYIVCLPRTAPGLRHCPFCFYDFSGLEWKGLVCPECGRRPRYKCVICGFDLSDRDPVDLICPECKTRWQGELEARQGAAVDLEADVDPGPGAQGIWTRNDAARISRASTAKPRRPEEPGGGDPRSETSGSR